MLWWGYWVPERTVMNQVWFIRKDFTEENVMRGKVFVSFVWFYYVF